MNAAETALVRELSKAPWPAYASAAIDGDVYVFMLPRKCASNTIKHAVAQIAGAVSYLTPPELTVTRAPRIAAVRHPVSRLVSCWQHCVIRDGAQFMRVPGVYGGMPWSAFVDVVCNTGDAHANYHFRSYSDELLFDGRHPDVVLKAETLERDWGAVTERYGWPLVALERLNASGAPTVEVTPEQIRRLAVRYARDAANFGYVIDVGRDVMLENRENK